MGSSENRFEFFPSSKSNAISRKGERNENQSDGFHPKFKSCQGALLGDSNSRILSERNENIPVSHGGDPYVKNGISNKNQNSSSGHSCSAVSECVDRHHETTAPYDPLSNYLSPRPKYLRFNPNKRNEIFTWLEEEVREDLSSKMASCEVADVNESPMENTDELPSSPLDKSSLEIRNDELMEGDDDCLVEDEELSRGRWWFVKGVMKLLFTFIACVFLTSYICPMNSSSSLGSQDAIRELNNDDFLIKNLTLEVDVFSVNAHSHDFFGLDALDDVYSHGFFEEDFYQEIRDTAEDVMYQDSEKQTENSGIDANSEETESFFLQHSAGEGSTDESNVVQTDKILQEMSDMELEISEMEAFPQLVDSHPKEIESFHLLQQPSADFTTEGSAGESNLVPNEEILEEESKMEPEIAEMEAIPFSRPEDALSEETESFHLLQHSENSISEGSAVELNLVVLAEEIVEAESDKEAESKKVEWDSFHAVLIYATATFLTALALIYHSKNKLFQTQKPLQKLSEAEDRQVTKELHNLPKKVEFIARLPVSDSIEEPKLLNHYVPAVELISEINLSHESSLGNNSSKFINTPSEGDVNESYQYVTPPKGRISIPKKMGKRSEDYVATISVTPVRRSSRLRALAAGASLSPPPQLNLTKE